MAFPAAPIDGQVYTTGGVTYVFSSTKNAWQIQTYDTVDAAGALTSIKTVDGASSGLDADLLDGLTSSQFLRSDTNNTITSTANEKIILAGSTDPYIRWQEGTTDRAYIQWVSSTNSFVLVNQQSGEFSMSGGTTVTNPPRLLINATSQSTTGPGDIYGQIQFKVNGAAGINDSGLPGTDAETIAMITAQDFRNGTGKTNEDSGLAFYTSNSGTAISYRGGISNAGKWFVGTEYNDNNADALLNVSGSARFSEYIKIGDSAATAATAGAGAIKYGTRLLMSNGTDWLPIYLERDGTIDKPIFYLSDLSDVYNTDKTLYVNPAGLGDTVTYVVDFTTPSTPMYQATNTGTGFCVSTAGTVGGFSQGTGAAYDMWSAASYCMKANARLCSKANLGAATGSGCSHDSRGIWTTDTDASGNHWVGQGNAPTTGGWYDPSYTGGFTGFTNNEIGIRCCGTGADSALWEI